MTINSINFTAKLPTKTKFKADKVKKGDLPDFFRDRELFNSKKDRVTSDYFEYCTEDIPASYEYDTENLPYSKLFKKRIFQSENKK